MLPKIPDFILNTSVDFISTAKNADGDVTVARIKKESAKAEAPKEDEKAPEE